MPVRVHVQRRCYAGRLGDSATGGALATGGSPATGGDIATGGAPATGGTPPTGGTSSTGGTTAVTNLCATRTTVPSSGLITDFSEFTSGTAWTTGSKQWGGASALHGGTFFYGTSTVTITAFITGGALKLTASLAAGDYIGFGLAFDICGDASAFAGVSTLIGGTLSSAALKWQVDTSNDAPIETATGRGECAYTSEATKWSDCVYNGLTIVSGVALRSVSTASYTWSQYTGGKPVTTVDKNEIIGMRWQIECPSGGSSCVIDITLDDIKFHT